MVYLIDNPPASRQYRSPRREEPSGVVVVHTAENNPDENAPDTGAENVAAFIRERSTPGSYHDLCDSNSTIQLVRYSDEAFHDATGSNPHSYGVSAATQAAKWSQLDDAWVEATVRNMARAAARYATWIRSKYGVIIPPRRISRAESQARRPGFISHAERDPARRTDPGKAFPWELFLTSYNAFMNAAGGVIPDPGEDDDMPSAEEIAHAVWAYRSPLVPTDMHGVAIETRQQTMYLEEQAKSIAAGEAAIAKALEDGRITDAEYNTIARALSGKGREVPHIPYLPDPTKRSGSTSAGG